MATFSVDGSSGIMTMSNVDNTGSMVLDDVDVEECEITFAMDWVSGGAGTLYPEAIYRSAADLSTGFSVRFVVDLDFLTQDTVTAVELYESGVLIGSAALSLAKPIGTRVRVRIRSTANHFIRAWLEGTSEPSTWDLVTGSGSTLHGTVGLAGEVSLDVPTPDSMPGSWMLGAETGNITGTGGTVPLTNGLVNATISTAGQGRDGVGYCVILQAAAASAANIQSSTLSLTNGSMVFYVKFIALPTANATLLRLTGLPATVLLTFVSATSRVAFDPANGGTIQTGPVVTTGVWYRFDVAWDWRTTPAVHQWAVDGVAQTNATCTIVAPDTLTGATFGHDPTGSGNAAINMHYDDMVIIPDVSVYPLGETRILGLAAQATVTQVGTADAMCRFTTNGGVLDLTFNAANILAAIQTNVVSAASDGVYQRTLGAGNFVNVPMATYAVQPGEGILCVRAELIGWAASATTANISLLGNVGGSNETLFALANPTFDNSTSAPKWLAPMYNTSGNWDQAKLDAFALILGGSTDNFPVIGANLMFAEVAIRTSDDAGSSTIDLEFDDFEVCALVSD